MATPLLFGRAGARATLPTLLSRRLNRLPAALLCALFALWAQPGLAYDVLLRWTVPGSQIDGYRLYTGSASRTYGQPIDLGRPDSSTLSGIVYYSLRGLQPGTADYVAVTAYDAGMESAYSNERLFNLSSVTPPVASAGPDRTGVVGQVFTLGSDSRRGVNYFWEQTAGPPVTLSNRTTSVTQFSAATAATFQFTVTAYDGQGVAAQDAVSVFVTVASTSTPTIPTATATRTPTVIATRTPTKTPTPVLTAASTPTPSRTGTLVPTRTYTPTLPPAPTNTPTSAPPFEDADSDGVQDAGDNCPNDFNPAQSDINEDGIGDVCDSGTPKSLTLTRLQLKAAPNGLISIQAKLDATEWSSLGDALADGLTIGVIGSGLPAPEVLSFPSARCVKFRESRLSCTGVRGETARFTRQRAGNIFKLTISAKKRTFTPPLQPNAVQVVFSAGGLDRRDAIENCAVRRSAKSATCKK